MLSEFRSIDAFSRRNAVAAALLLCLRPAWSLTDDLQSAISTYTGGVLPSTGRVMLDVAPLVENGNTVPVSVTVESPMTAADHVTAIAIFNERNPHRDVARFALGPRCGVAQVATRIRLATTQKLVAIATLSDGSYWSHGVEVVVTLAACIE